MKIDRIRYDVTIPIAAYGINDHIGAEAIVDENEDPADAFLKLKSEVDKMARLAYPHLYKNGQPFESPGYIGMNVTAPPVDIESFKQYAEAVGQAGIHKTQPQEQRIGLMAEDILSCKSIVVLEAYKSIIKNKPELKEAYDKRYQELQKEKQ